MCVFIRKVRDCAGDKSIDTCYGYNPPHALTQHYDRQRSDTLDTVLFTDGLKRVSRPECPRASGM